MLVLKKGQRSYRFNHAKGRLVIVTLESGRKIATRVAPLVTAAEAGNYKRITTIEGRDLYYCLSLATQFSANFPELLAAYSLGQPQNSESAVAVTFYAKR